MVSFMNEPTQPRIVDIDGEPEPAENSEPEPVTA